MNRLRLRDIPIEPNDLDAIIDMSIRSLQLGRPPKFENSAEGLEDFRQASLEYLRFIQKTNSDPDCEHALIPDIESWATYIGTTRKTIWEYSQNRNTEWQAFIAQMKGIITSAKKQLAYRQKIPTVLAIFDLCNNSGYSNSSEFRLQPIAADEPVKPQRTPEQIATQYGSTVTKYIEEGEMPPLPEE